MTGPFGPPGRLPLDDPVELPWVIVDLAWAMGKPSVIDALHAHGIMVMADPAAWRYREPATFSIPTMAGGRGELEVDAIALPAIL